MTRFGDHSATRAGGVTVLPAAGGGRECPGALPAWHSDLFKGSHGPTPEQVLSSWPMEFERRLFFGKNRRAIDLPSRASIDDPLAFTASIRSGVLGDLSYCHLDVAPHIYVANNSHPRTSMLHLVVLQLSGTSTFSSNAEVVRLRPGNVLLMHGIGKLRVEHETRVEQLLLIDPLAPDVAGRFKSRNLNHWAVRGAAESMAFRWVNEACVSGCWDSSDVSHDVSRLLPRLLVQILGSIDRQVARDVPLRLTRECIEGYIGRQLDDPELNASRIAEAFGCSVRTLHRAFGGVVGETLERRLWQMRIDACAESLRDSRSAKATLTELALRHGFTSPTHFSTLFRRILGVTPSEYRRRQHGR